MNVFKVCVKIKGSNSVLKIETDIQSYEEALERKNKWDAVPSPFEWESWIEKEVSIRVESQGEADFQGTELERDVIQAATAWYEEFQENADPEYQPTRSQAALVNAVLSLGAESGGF